MCERIVKRSINTATARLHNSNGNALILAMMFLTVITTTSLAILDMTVVYNNQMTLASNWVRERIILESIADYFVLGMKQRWCIDNTLTATPNGTGSCTFTNDQNLERLITDDEFVTALAEAGQVYGVPLPAMIRIPSMTYNVPVSSIPASNPLSTLFKQPGMDVFNQITIQIERMDNKSETTSGQESYLKIRVTLQASKNLTIFRNTAQIWLERRLGIFRRDLGYFSLVVPRDLYLDGTTAGRGDFSLLRGTGGTGLRFESPVFVNRDVYLPGSGAPNAATFADTIIQGNGIVRRASNPFVPSSLGAFLDQYWNQVPSSDGILAGISNDGRADLGLDALVGNISVTPVSSAITRSCITLNRVMNDIVLTRDSQMMVRRVPNLVADTATVKRHRFDFGFSAAPWPIPFVPTPGVASEVWMKGYNDAGPWPNFFNLHNQRAGWVTPSISPPSGTYAANATFINPALGPVDDLARPVFHLSIVARGTSGVVLASYVGSATVGTVFQIFPRGTGDVSTQVDVLVTSDYPNYNTAKPAILQTAQIQTTFKSTTATAMSMPATIAINVEGFDNGEFAAQDRRNPTFDHTNPFSYPYPLNPATYGASQPRVQTETRTPGRTNLAHIVLAHNGGSNYNIISGPTTLNTWGIHDATLRPTGYPAATTPAISLFPTGVADPGYVDYAQLYKDCAVVQNAKSSSFAIGAPDQSFLNNTRSSWNYNNPDPALTDPANPPPYGSMPASSDIVIDSSNQDQFHNQALMGTCTVASTADHVVGFFVCDRFRILSRSRPLVIVGTVITGDLQIDPSAYQRGITFRNIFHPQSILDMRNWGTPPILQLHREPPEVCPLYPPYPANGNDWPVWHPQLSVKSQNDGLGCNSIFFQRKTDNFRWTQVDPDCGFDPLDPTNHHCKHRPYKFLIKLIGDQYLLK